MKTPNLWSMLFNAQCSWVDQDTATGLGMDNCVLYFPTWSAPHLRDFCTAITNTLARFKYAEAHHRMFLSFEDRNGCRWPPVSLGLTTSTFPSCQELHTNSWCAKNTQAGVKLMTHCTLCSSTVWYVFFNFPHQYFLTYSSVKFLVSSSTFCWILHLCYLLGSLI